MAGRAGTYFLRTPKGNVRWRTAPLRKIIPAVSSGTDKAESRPGMADTSRFTVRRLRSAFSLWQSSLGSSDLLAAGILVALSLAAGAYVFVRAQASVRLAFAEKAQRLHAAVTDRLSVPLEDLTALSSLLESSGRVTRRQFHLLTDAMLRPDPMLRRRRLVYAFEWLPFIRDSERLFQEAEARAAGLTEYRFWQVGPDGKPRDVPKREYYVPIQYMEPPNARALGFDIASDPRRWSTAQKARDSGLTIASSAFGLLEDEGRADASRVVALYAPVYDEGDPGSESRRRASLAGFALAIVRVPPLAEAAASSADAAGLAFTLRDENESSGAEPLAERPRGAARLRRRPGYDIRYEVLFADRRWSLHVFALPGAFLAPTRGAIEVAALGLFASLLGLAVVTSLRTISRLRRQAEKVGPYRLIAKLGHGAMGVVWEARHALLRRPTAVKLLAPGTQGERSIARFEREVQLTAGLTHPSTIAIYDYGRTADGVFYYAMELLRGINLTQLVAVEGPLPPGRVVHLLRQACGALSEAHAAGLIHRDIKPANLMVCVYGGIPDFLKILDFGLVKDLGAVDALPDAASRTETDAELSQDGTLLGTPLYMAPEGMSDPGRVDPRADLFALGAVGYFLLSGSSPFPGHTALEVFTLERKGPPPPLGQSSPYAVSKDLEETLQRCLSFERGRRPESADALEGLLSACEVAPPWTVECARAWWRERGPAALEAAKPLREEATRYVELSSGDRARRRQSARD